MRSSTKSGWRVSRELRAIQGLLMKLKDHLRLVIPPIIWKIGQKIYDRKKVKHQHDFGQFIKSLPSSNADKIPDELFTMMDAYFKYISKQKTSQYWHYLNAKNVDQLISDGFDNFKQTIGTNYFLFTDISAASHLVSQTKEYPVDIERSEIFKQHTLLGLSESIQLNLITYLLVNHYLGNGERELNIEEPTIGNPPHVVVQGKRITSDLITSLSEYSVLTRFINLKEKNSIVEIGAGYGRTAYVILKHQPHLKYFICDIPPALYMSKTYLEKCFPEKRTAFIHSDIGKVECEQIIKENDLIFLLPNLLGKIGAVDVFLAIDCLHEMKKEDMHFFLDAAERMTKYFYFKCWKDTVIPFDNIRVREGEYIHGRKWNSLLHEDCIFPDNFFQGLYRLQ
jgi:putative sugar O-methyltransferase